MSASKGAAVFVQVSGDQAFLVDRLREPLQSALGTRHTCYIVHIASVGRVGEVLVRVSGSRGHLPLLFGPEEIEPGYVARVVADNVRRFGL